jgi:hypothetical protein
VWGNRVLPIYVCSYVVLSGADAAAASGLSKAVDLDQIRRRRKRDEEQQRIAVGRLLDRLVHIFMFHTTSQPATTRLGSLQQHGWAVRGNWTKESRKTSPLSCEGFGVSPCGQSSLVGTQTNKS